MLNTPSLNEIFPLGPKPELLAPAGSLEKLKVVVSFGADAVYLGGDSFGLRSAAQNFSLEELRQGVVFAHERGAKVFLVINGFLFDHEIEKLETKVKDWQECGVDAFIVSDPGSISVMRDFCSRPIHLSTQASCLNVEAAKVWKRWGVKRLILGRECSLEDAKIIKEATGLEVEVFIHGALCMSYSGHCVISNYTQGRDSNRGGCAQSCRFSYGLKFKNEESLNGVGHSLLNRSQDYGTNLTSTFLSSKDLMALDLIGKLKEYQIDSFKIEGRMKTSLYAGLTTKVYREAIDGWEQSDQEQRKFWAQELRSYSHRDYTDVGIGEGSFTESVFEQEGASFGDFQFIGQVLEIHTLGLVCDLRSGLSVGEEIELIPPQGKIKKIRINSILDLNGKILSKANPNRIIIIPVPDPGDLLAYTLLRRQEE